MQMRRGLVTTALLALALSAAGAWAQQASPRVEQLLLRMTLEEKIGQLNQIPGGRSKSLNLADIRGRASFRIAEPTEGTRPAAAIITPTAEESMR